MFLEINFCYMFVVFDIWNDIGVFIFLESFIKIGIRSFFKLKCKE